MTNVTALSKRAKVKLVKQHRGMISRIAKRCRVNQEHVGRVLRGQSVSARISAAIDRELQRQLDKEARLDPARPTQQQEELARAS